MSAISAAIVRRKWRGSAPTAAANCCAARGEGLGQADADDDRQHYESQRRQTTEQRLIIETRNLVLYSGIHSGTVLGVRAIPELLYSPYVGRRWLNNANDCEVP